MGRTTALNNRSQKAREMINGVNLSFLMFMLVSNVTMTSAFKQIPQIPNVIENPATTEELISP